MRLTASIASGATTGNFPRAFAATSASTKNLRLAWAQHAASINGSGRRLIARVVEHRGGRVGPAERPLVAHVHPGSPGHGLALGENRDRSVVGVHPGRGEHVSPDQVVERTQQHGTAPDLVRKGREAEVNALP